MINIEFNPSSSLSNNDLSHHMMHIFSLSLDCVLFTALTFHGLSPTLNHFVIFSLFIIEISYQSLLGHLLLLIYSKIGKRMLLLHLFSFAMIVRNLHILKKIGLLVVWDLFLCNLTIHQSPQQWLHIHGLLANVYLIVLLLVLDLCLSSLILTLTLTTKEIIIRLLVK